MAAALGSAGCAAARPPPPSARHVGKPLALSAPDLHGLLVDVGGDQGRVRVVDFWATWCEPCKDALPALDALSRELGPRGLSVYGISIDEDRAQIVDYLAKLPVGFPMLWDKGGERVQRFDVVYMPVTLVVDRRGIVRHVHQGWTAGRAAVERQEVEALLAEP